MTCGTEELKFSVSVFQFQFEAPVARGHTSGRCRASGKNGRGREELVFYVTPHWVIGTYTCVCGRVLPQAPAGEGWGEHF